MPWLQLKLDIRPDQADYFEDLLLQAGCSAVTLEDSADQPLFEPDLGTTPLWEHTRLSGLFDAGQDAEQLLCILRNTLKAEHPNDLFPNYKIEILEDKDWERAWMDSFHPIRFGKRLWVCPSWRKVPDPTAANLMLDPGLAFGTGTHPTTALCLEWLEGQELEGTKIIDYGCGSGILGIAALLLGADHLVATDIDPQALQATAENARRNQIATERFTLCYPREFPEIQSDILIANILAGPLIELAPQLAALVKQGGRIALSGILDHQANAIIEAYTPWFDVNPASLRDEWARVDGTKR
jgi:ribosomal protein L11 methyltransferase